MVKTLREQVSGLESAVLSLASPPNTTEVSPGDRQETPAITADIT
ncbi:hypothetical protein [Allocoleopsis sp.]